MTKGGLAMHIICVTTIAHAGDLQLSKTDDGFQKHLEKIYATHPIPSQEKDALETIWSYYYRYPIPLTQNQLEKLKLLAIASPTQIRELTLYIEQYGALVSCYELQAIPTWDTTTIQLILPFVAVSIPWHTRARKATPSEEFMVYLTPDKILQKTPQRYLGNASKVLVRYQVKKPSFYRFTLIASKEPHEPFYWNGTHANMYGPLGYWGGYGMIENIGYIQKCIIGDYQIGLGQGLMLGTTFSMDKSQEVIKVMKAQYQGIQPYGSFQRKEGFRGFACSLQKDDYRFLLFASHRRLDITVHHKGGHPYITTLATKGIAYTSPRSVEKKDSVQEKVLGTALIYQNPTHTFTLGGQAIYSTYSIPLNLSAGLRHNLFFQGTSHVNIGLFGNGLWRNYHFFAEVAHAYNNSLAGIGGTMASLGKKIDAACLLYHYPPHFHSLHGHAFGRKGAYNRNKQGCYLSAQYRPMHELEIKGYLDIGKHLVPQKTLHHAPAYQQEMMASAVYKRTRTQIFTLTLKGSHTPKNKKGSKLALPLLKMEKKGKATFKATYPFKKKHDAYTQIQLSCLQANNQATSYGMGIKQLFHYKHEDIDFKGWMTLYHTQSYDTAIRLYTHNLRGGMSYPPRYGSGGFEAGILARYRITKNLRIGVRFILNRFAYAGAQSRYVKEKGGAKVSLQLTYK